jgi:formylglycine-generating enzyme required for sulfatase activity
MLFGDYYIVTRLLDVEHNMVVNSYNKQAIQLNSSQQVVSVAQEIASKLSDKTIAEQQHGDGSSTQDFTETAYGVNMKMIWVEGGEFLMGCTSEQGNDCEDDEENVRRVTVDGFYIGMLEVTQSQWKKVMGTTISQQWTKANFSGTPTRGVGDDYPMYCVSWEEAMEFCRLLSIQTGKTYTLPTEAQWEYAARGGCKNDGTKYAGSHLLDAVGWYADNSGDKTNVVGSKRANALGIYDMSGNVWEWCKDWYASSYSSSDTNNPTGPSSGSDRVNRGGAWFNGASVCRVANRSNLSPGDCYYSLGFRVVLLP